MSYKHRHVLGPFLDRLAYVNEGRAETEKLNFRFSVKITNGFNIKNGCRAYSLAGGLVKESKKTDDGEESFEEYFRRTRNDEPVEYDVKGSVPRINRLVDSGVWDDWNVDPYTEMFPGFCTDPAKRKIAKDTYMLYEFEQSGLKIKSAVARKCPEFVKSEGGEEIRQTMEYWYEGVWKWQGDSLGSLAFLYEDAAYSVVDAALKKLGYDFIRKFDCWVFPKGHKPAEKDFHELVRNCVLSWYKTEYAEEREELEFLENAGVRELKRHLFPKNENTDMKKEPVWMGGTERHSHPARKSAEPAKDLQETPPWLTQKLLQTMLDVGMLTWEAAEEVVSCTPYTWRLNTPCRKMRYWEQGLSYAEKAVNIMRRVKGACGEVPKLESQLVLAEASLAEWKEMAAGINL